MTKTKGRWWALAALAIALIGVGLDATVLNLALPTLARELRASSDQLQWFVAAYTLALAAGMLPGGLLGDRFGRKRVLLSALVLFAGGSVACAYAASPEALIAARAVLGVGAAFLVTMSLSSLTVLFDEAERPRAVGVWAAANFLALPIGPILGGWILTNAWWGWVFLINIPMAVLALVAVAAFVPESRATPRPVLDPIGIVTSSAGLAALTYGLIQAGQLGWTDATAVMAMVGGLALLVAFAVFEVRVTAGGRQALVDTRLFASRTFAAGSVLAGLGIVAMFGAIFAIPQYFQAVLGVDPQGAGFRLLPVIAGIVIGAVPADRLSARIGRKLAVALGFAVLAVSSFVGSTTTIVSSEVFVALWIAGCGAGMGLALSTAASAALSELSAERSGVGSALFQAVNKLGGPFGVAVMGSVLAAAYRDAVPVAGLPAQVAAAIQKSVFAGIAVAQQTGSTALLQSVRTAFVSAMDAMLAVAAVVAVASFVLALAWMPSRAAANADAGERPEWRRAGVA
jgi:MFS transporter, DHA2 family, multidrug resistance protein